MPDFFDHLWLQMNNPRANRDRAQYLARLRSLIQEAPPPSALPRSAQPQLVTYLAHDFSNKDQGSIWAFDKVTHTEFEPARLRAAKSITPGAYVLRLDPLGDEAEVLESRAMGVDGYVIDLSCLDSASAQYLIEVGIDYSCDALALCRSEEDLARALTTHIQAHILLTGELVAPQLLELELMRGRKVWMDLREASLGVKSFDKPDFVQLMLLP